MSDRDLLESTTQIWPFDILTLEQRPFLVSRKVFTKGECQKIIEAALPTQQMNETDRYGLKTKGMDVFERMREGFLDPYSQEWIATRLKTEFVKANSYYRFDLLGFINTFRVLEYRRGHFLDWHNDAVYVPNKLSCTLMLCSDFEGGEIEIDRPRQGPQLEQGDVTIFPSYAMHRVKRVTKGRRIILGAWVAGPRFR